MDLAAADPVISQIFQLVPEAKDQDVVEALLQDKAYRESLAIAAPERVSLAVRMLARLKAVAMLALLYLVSLPLTLATMMLALVLNGQLSRRAEDFGNQPDPRGTALVSGGNKTKSLAICRHLHRAGWRVVLVEVQTGWGCGTRFSNCISAFHSTPRPNTDPVNYLKAIQKIAADENAKLWVPVSMAQYSVYEALAAKLMPAGCKCCTLDAPLTALLNDKIKFTRFAQERGLDVPSMFSITSKQQLVELNNRPEIFVGKRFLLKSIAYESISRADLFTLPCPPKVLEQYVMNIEFSKDRPWMLQQFLQGAEFSCYTIAHHGKVVVHVDNKAELSCLNYDHIGLPEIQKWVEKFCRKTGSSGQLCFDFMYDKEGGTLLAIECNPRTSTNLLAFYNHPNFAAALSDPDVLLKLQKTPLLPLPKRRPVHWIWNEIGKVFLGKVRSVKDLQRLPAEVTQMLKTLLEGVDAVFDIQDPLPFLALHYLQIPVQLARIVWLGTPWLKLDLCSGKVVELGGD